MLIDAAEPSVPAKNKARRWSDTPTWVRVAIVVLGLIQIVLALMRLDLLQDQTRVRDFQRTEISTVRPATTLAPGCPYVNAPVPACEAHPVSAGAVTRPAADGPRARTD